MNTVLADARDESNLPVPTNIQIGWQAGSGQDPLPEAMVCLSAPNTVTGTVIVFGNLQLGTSAALNIVAAIDGLEGRLA